MYKYLTGIDVIDSKTGGLNPGTNILVLAPSFSDGEQITSLLSKPQKGEYMIVLSTEHQAEELIPFLEALGFPMEYTGIIDAISKSSTSGVSDTTRIKYVGSPNDLTGMDIRFSQMSEEIMKGEFTDDPNQLFPTPIRYCVLSLTSLLMFRQVDVIYQFVHVITSKLKKMGSIGVFMLNSESFDAKTIAILKQLMNVVVEVQTDELGNSMRLQGSLGLSMNWRLFHIEEGNFVFY